MATNNKPKTTRIVCIRDTHNRYDFPIPDGDILIHAGDFSNTGTQIEIENFLEYLKSLKQYRLKIVIAGNHDITLDPDFYEKSWAKWHGSRKQNYQKIRLLMYDPVLRVNYGIIYLEQEDYIDRQTGLKFYGSPYQPGNPTWAFRLPVNSPEIKQVWSRIPTDVDVLITHGPPANILDLTSRVEHVGCAQLLARVNQLKPQLHVFGHIHEAYGCLKQNSTLFVNASICNHRYQPVQPPIIIDLDIK